MAYEDEKKGELETLLNDILEDKNTNLTPENLKRGVTVLGVDGNYIGTDTSDATATNEDVLEGKTAYAQGQKLTGTLRVEDVDSVLDMFPSIETEISEEIDIKDAVENSFNDLSIYGNSKQESTTGKNLLYEIRSGYLTTVENQEATTTEGSQFGNWQINFKNKDGSTSISLEAGEYYVSLDLKINSGSVSNPLNLIALSNKDGQETINNPVPTTKYQRYCFKSIFNSAKNVNNIIIQKHYDEEICSFKIKNVMISTISDYNYEPYTGGNPSPNPDYPQEIESIGNKDTFLLEKDAKLKQYINAKINQSFALGNSKRTKVFQNVLKVKNGKKYTIVWTKNTVLDNVDRQCVITNDSNIVVQEFMIIPDTEECSFTANVDGMLSIGLDLNSTAVKISKEYGEVTFKRIGKNYNKYPYYDGDVNSKNGITYTAQNDYSIKIEGTSTGESYYNLHRNYKIRKGTYKVSVIGLTDDILLSVVPYLKDGSHLDALVFDKKNTVKDLILEEDVMLDDYIAIVNTGVTTNTIVYLQIEKGSEATEYEPYNEDAYTLPIQQEMLEEDYIKDVEYHTWGKIILTGNENNWNWNPNDKPRVSLLIDDSGIEILRQVIISNYFKYIGTQYIDRVGIGFIYNRFLFLYYPENISSLDDWKSWLQEKYNSGNPVVVYYKLNTPIELPCTPEQTAVLSQLEQFKLDKGINHIFSDDELSPKFKLKYYRDINMMLESEIINNAESDFNTYYDSKVEEFNTNADEKLEEYNTNATSKINEYDANADEKLKGYNTNATNKINEYNTNAEDKLNEYNTNAEDKLTEFNTNATEKTTAYDTNADEKLEEYNTNAEDKLNEYNANASEKLSEYNSNAEAILKLLPSKTTEIAEVIDVDDSAESNFNKLSIFGNSEQKSTTGAAKVDFGAFAGDYSDEQMEIKIDENGIISLKGTVSAYYSKKIGTITKDMFSAGNNIYYIRGNNTNNGLIFIQAIGSISFSSNNNSPSFEITDESQESDLYIVVNYLESGTLNVNEILYPMISLESNALYEPYTGGNPSPNPDYPQEIESIKDSITFKRIGKNIFSINNVVGNGNNRLILNVLSGTSIAQQPFKLKSSEQVTVSFKTSDFNSINSWQLATALNDEMHNYSVASSQLTQQKTFTLNKDCDAIGLIFYAKNIFDTDFEIYDIQIEKGTEATEYEPYHEDVYTLPIQQNMYALVEGQEDCFVKKDGKWYERHYSFEGELTGEDYAVDKPDTRIAIYNMNTYGFSTGVYNGKTKQYLNYFKFYNNWDARGSFIAANTLWFSGFSDIETFKEFIKTKKEEGNPLKIVYIRGEENGSILYPLDLECTPEQTAVLNKLEQFSLQKGINHIFSDDELSPKFQLKYYQDMNILLDKINKNIADVSAQLL